MKGKIIGSVFFVLFVAMVCLAHAEIVTTGNDQQSISLTIYNSDLALVRDARRISFSSGEQVLAFKEISSRIMPETALIKGKDIHVIEQNFEFDLLTPVTLLNKYVGKMITLARTNAITGEETHVRAMVLSTASGIVFKIGNQIETTINGRLIYPDVPENLRDKPTLTMLVDSKKSSTRLFELSYLTRGLSWKADYVVELNKKENRLDLKGWVTLTNHSGAGYKKAKLQLVAGDVNRVRPDLYSPREKGRVNMKVASAGISRMSEESLLDYHLYTVKRPTTVKDNQSKQIALLEENNGVCRKKLVLKSGSGHYYWNKAGQIYKKKGVDVFLEFKNDKASNFGLPKPAGIVRVYKKDRSGFSQFVGEDRIDHTPENENVQITLGRAFDVTADRKQIDFSYKKAKEKNLRIYETEYEIVLKNAKDKRVNVKVQEIIPGQWKVLSQSHTHKKEDAKTIFWNISVEAKGSTKLTFRVRSKV